MAKVSLPLKPILCQTGFNHAARHGDRCAATRAVVHKPKAAFAVAADETAGREPHEHSADLGSPS
ncbi:hypothetical protein AUC69_08520 [Methyloceanibacter superfactus]|uniref:Uncharacterized protein n=1 Tax=Methyloceanibacter superfactus TaxID=1774969 RepID=A0A1E3W1H2_9HYPH|nr:hypothetical protein [Methyloceanibacter superfactus]ODR99654.1 hypothetical protein AUC69_08520 [Methyloceanibacter superfactus]